MNKGVVNKNLKWLFIIRGGYWKVNFPTGYMYEFIQNNL